MSAPPFSQRNRPKVLKPGDTFGIAAPASPFDKEAFEAGSQVLRAMGFKLVVPPDIFDRDGYLAGTDRRRADQLMRLFSDPGIDGIISARGGYGAMRILTLLDAAVIARTPKPFVGFSDITVLLDFLTRRCGMVAFHGPTVTTLGHGDPATHERFLSALTTRAPIRLPAEPPRVLSPGRASGRFCCGNLTLFCHLLGTPFQPDFNAAILLVEDRGEAPYRIDRMLTQMRLAGCFDNLAGLALGTFSQCGSNTEVDRIVTDRLGDLDIPILGGFPVGHEGTNTTLPVGIAAVLDTASGTLAFGSPALD
ncbi:S66 peptidase family protein [Desulfosarcina ovata]|uniref:S66 peptidase family protein n=1 Tax=Desulfosarcina ovata TaxID=83564 RepID=UPI001390FC10|nr:LD-carboxypeptidase [Desulfosarcina ovata]